MTAVLIVVIAIVAAILMYGVSIAEPYKPGEARWSPNAVAPPVRSAAGDLGWVAGKAARKIIPERRAGWMGFGILLFAFVGAVYFSTRDESAPPAQQTEFSSVPSESAPGSSETPRGPTVEVPPNRWFVEESSNKMDGTREVSLSLIANSPKSQSIFERTPSLVIQCRNKKTELYVDAGTVLDPNRASPFSGWLPIRIKIDDTVAVRQHWTESTGDTAVFDPDPVQLARRLARAHLLLVEFTPFQRVEETAEFTLYGLKEVLPRVADLCGWKP
jgi:hypothetical protein